VKRLLGFSLFRSSTLAICRRAEGNLIPIGKDTCLKANITPKAEETKMHQISVEKSFVLSVY
jgi:hypothetical protein